MEKIKQVRELLTSLMSLEWCIGGLLLISYLDLYFQYRYRISIIDALREWNIYLTKLEDYLILFSVFSVVFAIIFPIIQTIYILFAIELVYKVTNGKFSAVQAPYGRDIEKSLDFKSLEQLRLEAAQDNNQVLFEYCKIKEKQINAERFIKYSVWGILFFSGAHYYLDANDHPLYISAILKIEAYLEHKIIATFLGCITLCGVILYLSDLPKINSDQRIYYPNRNKK